MLGQWVHRLEECQENPSLNAMTPNVQVSDAGYVHLTYAAFRKLPFCKRMAFEDDTLRRELTSQVAPVLQAGFCDWVDTSTHAQVCIGWAWYLRLGESCERFAPGGFSSNVNFIRHDGKPMGTDCTERLLQEWLTRKPWQSTLQKDATYRSLVEQWH